jgi:hypothetical protein
MLQLQRIQERKSELQAALTLKALSLCRHEGEVEASARKRGAQQQEVAIASPSENSNDKNSAVEALGLPGD